MYSGIVSANYEDTLKADEFALVSGLHLGFDNDALPLSKTYISKTMLNEIHTQRTEKVTAKSNNEIESVAFKIDCKGNTTLIIKSENGKIVFQKEIIRMNGPGLSSIQTVTWNLCNQAGQIVPNGEYSVFLDDVFAKTLVIK